MEKTITKHTLIFYKIKKRFYFVLKKIRTIILFLKKTAFFWLKGFWKIISYYFLKQIFLLLKTVFRKSFFLMEKTGFESRFFYLENIFFKQFWKTDFYTENSFFFQENSLKKKIILYRKQFLSCIEPCFKNQTRPAGPTSSTGNQEPLRSSKNP